MELTEVLRGGRQCDEDVTEIIMSRQACVEAANEIERLRTEVNALKYSLQLDEDLIGMIQKIIHILSIRPEAKGINNATRTEH